MPVDVKIGETSDSKIRRPQRTRRNNPGNSNDDSSKCRQSFNFRIELLFSSETKPLAPHSSFCPVRDQAMLDYSDEEPGPELVRRQNFSTVGVNFPGIHFKSQKPFIKKHDEPLEDFPVKTQYMLREFKKKSSRLIMSKSRSSTTNAFIISEFIPASKFKSHKSNHFFLDNKEDHRDSFYKSMTTLIILAQFFGVFPVSGIGGRSYESLTFKWIHYKTAYWSLSFFGTIFCFVCSVMVGFDDGTFQVASEILYFGCGILSSLLMLNLSRNWRKLNKEFAQIEVKFKKYGYPQKNGIKFKIFTIVISLVALVWQNHFFCTNILNFWKGVLVLIAHFLSTANWNFKDFFLCMISWTIADRFKQIHDLLDKVQGQDKPISFWREVREDYNILSVLTKKIDSYTRKLMLISIGNNLFFICIQLFHSLKRKIDSYSLIYFFWSFGFLVLRTGLVAFSAARINDESKEPKTSLFSVPYKNYTMEVRRFLTQLTTNEVALTGGGFFLITRSLILTIIGTVITYELVLMQFGSKEIEDDLFSNRTICISNKD